MPSGHVAPRPFGPGHEAGRVTTRSCRWLARSRN